MMRFVTRFALLMSTILALPLLATNRAQSDPSMPPDPAAIAGTASEEAVSAFAVRGGARGAHTPNVSRGHVAHRNVNLNHNVNRNINRNVNINPNVDINRNIARAGVGRGALVRPVRPWVRRPYYGTVIAGVTLGTIIAATDVPVAPRPDLCVGIGRIRRTRAAILTTANRSISLSSSAIKTDIR
jgi:hypothetical protein